MGMNATINGQEYKFSGLLASAYAWMTRDVEVPSWISLDHAQQIELIFTMARLMDNTPIVAFDGSVRLQSVISRAGDCHKLAALIEFASDPDTADKPLVFA
jgi:hypothetical protein